MSPRKGQSHTVSSHNHCVNRSQTVSYRFSRHLVDRAPAVNPFCAETAIRSFSRCFPGFSANLIRPFRQPKGRRNSMPTKKKSSARKYGKAAGKTVASAMRRRKRGTLKSGPGGKGGTVKSRRQAIAIGLSESRKKGAKVPRKRTGKRSARKK